ncbi:piggyBac transposable element-derived protein 3 [Nephila pilipes]|uniref:PiggyBac transposable element-derived protein 3 n=1 Tax=Nephila pilipes TaxID=299642 RepID=A0A8X6TER5_NEPPI|nr:piggyBac transposable element-derived protein 3 [Nephila pilipes]
MDLGTLHQFFKYLWTDEIISNIYEESKRYVIQKNPSKPLTISENEINQYLGICIYAFLVHQPNYRAYWSEELVFDRIKETMPLKKFETIRQGFAYKLELYSGQENKEKYRQKSEPDLGASANVVIRLARIISRNKNYTLYFDNYYTSIPLLVYLSKEGIYTLGTINRNRIPNSKIPTEKVFNKMERGHSMEFVGNYNDVEISVTAWKDNKTVIMASTFAGEKPLGKVMRYDKKTKNRVEIIRPHVIEEYNKHVGGIDLFNSIIARPKILMRSKKWYKRVETDKKSENKKKSNEFTKIQI